MSLGCIDIELMGSPWERRLETEAALEKKGLIQGQPDTPISIKACFFMNASAKRRQGALSLRQL